MGSQYLSASIWSIVTAASLLMVLLAMGIYLWYRNRVKAVVEDASAVADLSARKDQLEAEIEQSLRWLENNREELLKRDAEREQQENDRQELKNLQTDLAQKEQKVDELKREASELQNVVSALSKDRDRLESEIVDFEEKKEIAKEKTHITEQVRVQAAIKAKEAREKLEDKRSKLIVLNEKFIELSLRRDLFIEEINDKKRKLDEIQTVLEQAKLRKELALDEASEEEKRLAPLKKQNDKYQHEIDEKKRQINDFVMKITESSIQNDALGKEIDSKHNKLIGFKKTLKKLELQQEDAKHKVKQTEEQLSDAKQNLMDTKGEVAIQERFEEEAALKVQKSNIEIDRLKSEETALKSSIRSLEVLAKRLNKQLDGQEGDATAHEDKYRDLWHPVSFPDLSPVAGSPNEKQFLKYTADYIKGKKLYFSERVLYAFHTALKVNDISPLVVLAGISGTGKSELPRRYAEGMGLHFVILPVQPRWDSPQDLFGFYNYLEGRYKATELARAMVQFELYNRHLWPLPEDWNDDRSDRMLLVLLDEMNLARVEYYFSEFLSRLEFRRGINQEEVKKRVGAEISLEMGSLREGEKPIRLFPGQNIRFSGTMNEDETTQALSDKVLDRACVMRFGRPKKIMDQVNVPETNPSENGLTFDQWTSWLKKRNSLSDKDKVNRWINDLNDAMDNVGRPFAHRVIKAIQSYVANYPDWVSNRIGVAMADQIEQRIMPKLRGIEIEDANQPLKKIRSIIEECDDQKLLKAFKKGSENQQIFLWKGIDRMEYND